MRLFVIQILLLTGFSTIAVLLVGSRLLGGTTIPPSSDAGDVSWHCYDESLKANSDVRVPVRGRSHLCLGERSVKAVIEAENLRPGEVYTAWMAYIDTPAGCTATPCPLSEVSRINPQPVLTRFDAAIADTFQRATFVGTFRSVTFAQGSQIQLVLAAHGPVLTGEIRARKILGAHWPGAERDETGQQVAIGRAHFTLLEPFTDSGQ